MAPRQPPPLPGPTPSPLGDRSLALQSPAAEADRASEAKGNTCQTTEDPIQKDIGARNKPPPRLFVDYSVSEGPSFAAIPATSERPQRLARVSGATAEDPSTGEVGASGKLKEEEGPPSTSDSSTTDSGGEDLKSAEHRHSRQEKHQVRRIATPSYLVMADYLEDESGG